MSPEKQRIAIAKACGYVDPQLRPRRLTGNYEDDLCESLSETTEVWGREIPDYLNDLNAMHAAESTLSVNDTVTYASNLTRGHDIWEVMPNDEHFSVCYGALHATAAQRAEAFLRTLSLWRD